MGVIGAQDGTTPAAFPVSSGIYPFVGGNGRSCVAQIRKHHITLALDNQYVQNHVSSPVVFKYIGGI